MSKRNKLKMLKNGFLKNTSYLLMLERDLGKPTVLNIESTNACMMDCIMCPRRNMTREIGFMDFELFKRIVRQLKWNADLRLHGFGDPLIHPGIVDMIEFVSTRGIKPMISVNPNLLTPEMSEKLLNSGLHTLFISLDGVDEETYGYYRGRNAGYNKAIVNIESLLNAKNNKSSTLNIVLSMIRMESNRQQDKEFKRIWERDGVDEVRIKSFLSFDGSDSTITELGSEEQARSERSCSVPWFKVTVTWDGKVVPCCYDYDAKYIIGDLNRDSLEVIWKNSRMRELRKQIRVKTLNENPLCHTCLNQMDISAFKGRRLGYLRRGFHELRFPLTGIPGGYRRLPR